MNPVITTDPSNSHSLADRASTLDPIAVYDAVWNNSNDGMYALTVLEGGADFRFIAFNQAVVDHTLLPTHDLKEKRLSEALLPERAEQYRQYYNLCLQTGATTVFEEQLPISTDDTCGDTWWRLSIYPIHDSFGKIHQLLVSATDITCQKQTELALDSSKQVLQQVIDAMPDMIVWKDRESTYLGCNRSFLSITDDQNTADIVGKTDYDMPWKRAESDWFRECDRKVMDRNCPELNIIEPQLQTGGRQAWLSTSKIPLHDEAGLVTGILVIVEDITDRKDSKDHEATLLDILKATPDIVGIIEASGHHRYLNQAGQQMFNTPPEQVQALRLVDLTHSETAKMLIAEALPIAREQGIWSGESTIFNAKGQEIPVSHVIVSHKSEAGLTERYSSIMRDISDRKAAETLLKQQSEELSNTLTQLQKTQAQIIQSEKMSSLGQMVAGVAHEINNPVNFIHGNLQPACNYTQELLALLDLYGQSYTATPEIEDVLEDIDLDFIREDLPKLLNSMAMGTDRIRAIVLSLRNFSRLDEAAVKTVDIHEGIDSTLVILNHRLKINNNNRAIEIIKQYGELSLVDCYPSQLNQVLMNILSNAIDALADQSLTPQITITTELQGDFVNIRIKDNGAGIPKAIQAQILNPFFTTKPVGKGTGMGMPISYQIITEKHGGQLTFTSTEGQGTEFFISIPIQQATESLDE